jgi:hypothetical protein
MTDQQAIIHLERKYPDWLITRGTDRMCHGWPRSSGGVLGQVTGEDWTDLRDQIVRETRLAESGQRNQEHYEAQ